MCGICGVGGRDGAPPLDGATLRRMTDSIVHRGPDEDGAWIGPGVALGMRRLSIIDLAGSHQPVVTESGDVRAVFNGEIYNFASLRADLLGRGHRLATHGDSETIVHLYEEHGLDFVRHLRGMFAIALWDASRRRLVLARDRLGVKPLYYAETPAGLAFASEVKALLAGGLVTAELDPVAAELFLAHGFVPGPRTLFAGVRKLPAASLLVWERGAIREERIYWDALDTATRSGGDWQEDQEELLSLLRTSVADRMIADVPLGVMLSGGLDSSLIAALMAERSDRPIRTFSIGFAEDGEANELGDARAVAKRLGADHHELLTSATDHPDLLDEALWHLEEPIADVSFLGFALVSRLAREHVTVALSGQGADELLGGYRKHQIAAAAAIVQHLPRSLRRGLLRASTLGSETSTVRRGLTALAADEPDVRFLAMSRVLQSGERRQLLSPGFRSDSAEFDISDAVLSRLPAGRQGPLASTLVVDTRLALPDNMLLYFDKLSMASSLEVRVPFMDHDVVAFCAGLRDDRRVHRFRRKELLRRVSRGLVDDAIIDKPKRGFFHSALGAWLSAHRDGLVTETLLDGRAFDRGQYDPDAVRGLVASSEGKKANQVLLSLLMLERWQRLFVDGDAAFRNEGQQLGHVAA